MLTTRLYTITFLLLSCGWAIGQSSEIQLANEYYQQGELEKAKASYDQLANDRHNISQIHANYVEVLKQLAEPKDVQKYFSKIIDWFPDNLQFQIGRLAYYFQSGDTKNYEKELSSIQKQYASNRFQLSIIGQELATQRMYQTSADFFLMARQTSGSSGTYALELSRIYSLLNQKEKMVNEYLTYAKESRQNLAYIKNIFQNLLREEEDLSYLERALISRMQLEPEDRTYPDLMIWVEMQRKNFYAAFLQARALDKREQSNGNETMNVGRIALDNKSWEDAITIFEFLSNTYFEQPTHAYYRKMLIEAKEGKLKEMYPVPRDQIKSLSREYTLLYNESGPNNNTYEALRNQAKLHAFYLGEIDTAAIILRHLIESPRVPGTLVAQSKLDLGDIYLLRNQPWEATLLYSQVEKSHRDSPLAYDAKLKNARLHYFTGNFSLAKSHLDILKRATTREISNDAIDLTILISDNTYLDSTDVVMQEYANINLMIFQNQNHRAEAALVQMIEKNRGHSILDEVYWQLASLLLKEGRTKEALLYLEKIQAEFGFDILADDAAFKIAEIYERQLGDLTTAQDLYRKFMIDFPGSMYAVEARLRFRKLRGDFDSKI